ncbi:MAG TPA: hypothetical protein VHH14_07495, partial [Solirubrobacterales bacterium]|nr:hypothetical protein [Solirubrobacterales bacterium]
LATRIGWRASVRPALWGIVLVAGLALPALANGGLRFATESPLTDAGELGNLFGPLQLWQLAGIWPAGDFRLEPEQQGPAYVLIGLAVAAGAGAAVHAWRRRAWPVLVYTVSLLLACVPICALGSPWVDAKALAGASPAIPFAAALAAAALYAAGRRIAGAIVIVAVLGGVLWSNALQYGGVNLAPRDQLAELEEIGDRFAGQGPTLMTEFQPYGVRHFLRDADPEGASELRRRQVPLADGGILEKGEFADTDRLDAAQLLVYRTLVLRRGPNQSRPPAAYDLAWTGDFYEVWQRLDPAPLQGAHLGLGIDPLPTARPDCADVRELAATAGTEGTLLGARRPPGIEVPFENAEYPPEWAAGAPAGQLVPQHGGEITATVDVPRFGDYDVWIGGSVRSRAELLIDGEVAGGVRHQLDYSGVFIPLGDAALSSGEHELTVRFGGPDLHPGSAGLSAAVGPLIVSSVDAAGAQVDRIPAEDAEERICGRSWDWIEVAG